tara:strand:- start:520 stop:663 length:144 start_codon:yes stop_codon:yes gene_type:complete
MKEEEEKKRKKKKKKEEEDKFSDFSFFLFCLFSRGDIFGLTRSCDLK